jgi:hypothetical protein
MASLPGREPAHLSTLGVTGRSCFNRKQPAELLSTDSFANLKRKKTSSRLVDFFTEFKTQ